MTPRELGEMTGRVVLPLLIIWIGFRKARKEYKRRKAEKEKSQNRPINL